MDLLGENPALYLGDEDWRIYSRHDAHAPQFAGPCAVVENCSITEGCEIYGTVRNSVLGAGVRVMAGATVEDAVIMDNVVIGEGATVRYSIIDENVNIGKGCSIGTEKSEAKGIAVIAAGLSIPENTNVSGGDMVSSLADLKVKEDA